jgi:hypothetical protein
LDLGEQHCRRVERHFSSAFCFWSFPPSEFKQVSRLQRRFAGKPYSAVGWNFTVPFAPQLSWKRTITMHLNTSELGVGPSGIRYCIPKPQGSSLKDPNLEKCSQVPKVSHSETSEVLLFQVICSAALNDPFSLRQTRTETLAYSSKACCDNIRCRGKHGAVLRHTGARASTALCRCISSWQACSMM